MPRGGGGPTGKSLACAQLHCSSYLNEKYIVSGVQSGLHDQGNSPVHHDNMSLYIIRSYLPICQFAHTSAQPKYGHSVSRSSFHPFTNTWGRCQDIGQDGGSLVEWRIRLGLKNVWIVWVSQLESVSWQLQVSKNEIDSLHSIIPRDRKSAG